MAWMIALAIALGAFMPLSAVAHGKSTLRYQTMGTPPCHMTVKTAPAPTDQHASDLPDCCQKSCIGGGCPVAGKMTTLSSPFIPAPAKIVLRIAHKISRTLIPRTITPDLRPPIF